MKLYFLFGLKFMDLPLAACKELSKKYPNLEVTGLVKGRRIVCDLIDKNPFYPVKRYDFLDDLQYQWLNTPLDRKKLEEMRKIFGDQALRDLIASDREIGYGLVSGGIVERTKLIDMTVNDDDRRWAYIVGTLDYMLKTLKKDKPDLVFAYWIADTMGYAMYMAAKVLGIPVVSMPAVRIEDFWSLDDTIDNQMGSIGRLYDASLKKPSLVAGKRAEAKAFLEKFRARPSQPSYMDFYKGSFSLVKWARQLAMDTAMATAITLGLRGSKNNLRQRRGWPIISQGFWKFVHGRKALRNKHPDFVQASALPANTPYVYFPLHVDPESATMVLAPRYSDQMHVIERIARTLPVGMKLVVKEHLPMLGRRPKGFYKRIRQLPDVILMSPFENSAKLMKESALVAVIAGTASLEAAMLGRPALVLSNMFATKLKTGVTKAKLDDLETVLPQALNNLPQDKDLIDFLAAIFTKGFRMNFNDMWYNVNADMMLKKPEYAQRLGVAIEDYLSEVRPSALKVKKGRAA